MLEIKLGLYSFLTWIGLILASLVVIIDMVVLIANKEKPSNDYKESHPMRFKFHLVVINIAVMIIRIVDVKKYISGKADYLLDDILDEEAATIKPRNKRLKKYR